MKHRTMNQSNGITTEYKENNVVVWSDSTGIIDAWVNDGRTGWFIRPEEKHLNPETYLDFIAEKWKNGTGVYRCTGCGVEMKKADVAGWPLFAGCACKDCHKKHLDHLEHQRQTGQVCRFCGKPYDACCC